MDGLAIYAQLKPSDGYRREARRLKLASTKGGVMKKALLTVLEPITATLLVAFAIGLGIAVDSVFFLAALLIATGALVEVIVNAAGHLTHRHP